MDTAKKTISKGRWIGIIAALSLLMLSCNRVKDTVVSVTVVDQNNVILVGADVRIWHGGAGDRIDETATTNGAGQAIFNLTDYYVHGQAGLAVLDIDVTHQDTTRKVGFIEIIEEGTTEQLVTF